MILLRLSDFTGFELLATNTKAAVLIQQYIDRYEAQYIYKLLGIDLGKLFIADLANASQADRFALIEDAFAIEQEPKQYVSLGMKDFLACAVLYHYIKDTQAQHTQAGVADSLNEAMTVSSPIDASRYAERKFNEALDTVDAIQWYCKTYAYETYPNDPTKLYPEYNGQVINPVFSAFL